MTFAEILDHTIALYRALPDGRLCILPGTGHGTFIERPEWVNRISLARPHRLLKRWNRPVSLKGLSHH